MKMLTFKQVRDADRYTLEKQQFPSIDLMEKASKACVDWLVEFPLLKKKKKLAVFCGLGNNGGDGVAIARLLSEKAISVEVYVIHYTDKTSDDFAINLERIRKIPAAKIRDIFAESQLRA